MKKIKIFGLIGLIFLILSVTAVNAGYAREGSQLRFSDKVFLFIGGSRVFELDGKTVEEPLFVIKIGDTSLAEAEGAFWGGIFPGHAPSRTVYTRTQSGQNENWRAMTFRRPTSKEDFKDFKDSPEGYKRFSAEKEVSRNELPFPVNLLESDGISRIDSITVYLAGGIVINLNNGVSCGEAQDLAKKIADFLENDKKSAAAPEKEKTLITPGGQNLIFPDNYESWTRLEPLKIDYDGDGLADMEIITFLDPAGNDENRKMVEVYRTTRDDFFSFVVFIEKKDGQVLPLSYWQKKNEQWINVGEEEINRKMDEFLKNLAAPKKKRSRYLNKPKAVSLPNGFLLLAMK